MTKVSISYMVNWFGYNCSRKFSNAFLVAIRSISLWVKLPQALRLHVLEREQIRRVRKGLAWSPTRASERSEDPRLGSRRDLGPQSVLKDPQSRLHHPRRYRWPRLQHLCPETPRSRVLPAADGWLLRGGHLHSLSVKSKCGFHL